VLRGEFEAIREYHEQELAIGRTLPAVLGTGAALDCPGEFALRACDDLAAERLFQESVHCLDAVGHARLLAHVRGDLAALRGELARTQGGAAEAEQCYREALTFFDQDNGYAPASHIIRD
jgi:hypothetical protein